MPKLFPSCQNRKNRNDLLPGESNHSLSSVTGMNVYYHNTYDYLINLPIFVGKSNRKYSLSRITSLSDLILQTGCFSVTHNLKIT